MTQHFRGGQELPPLGTRRFFDFNFQPGVAVPPGTADLLPGDSLVTSCSYDTTDRSNVTKWVASLPFTSLCPRDLRKVKVDFKWISVHFPYRDPHMNSLLPPPPL